MSLNLYLFRLFFNFDFASIFKKQQLFTLINKHCHRQLSLLHQSQKRVKSTDRARHGIDPDLEVSVIENQDPTILAAAALRDRGLNLFDEE